MKITKWTIGHVWPRKNDRIIAMNFRNSINRVLYFLAASLALGSSSLANAALEGRLPATPDGADYQAYYDTIQDITWLANANLAATNNFGNPFVAPDGSMNWFIANNPGDPGTWIARMNAANHLGSNMWRLPVTGQPDSTCSFPGGGPGGTDIGTGCTGSEMGHLFNVDGISSAAPGPFTNIQSGWYISATLVNDPLNPGLNFAFLFTDGRTAADGNASQPRFAWPVTDGDPLAPQVSALSCVGFESPLDGGPVKVKKNRSLPFKAQLIDEDNQLIDNLGVSSFPVIQVIFDDDINPATDVSADALSSGAGTEGNQFEFLDTKWQFNLKTKNYSAAGTYTVTMESGDNDEYLVNPTCTGSFVIN